MGVCYEVLRPATKGELGAAGLEIAAELKKLPSGGYVSSDDLGEEALAWACASGILRRTSPGGRVMEFESVRFWVPQLNAPKSKNVAAAGGTRRSYSAALDAFNEWWYGRECPVRENMVADGRMEWRNIRRPFPDVGDLLGFCEGSGHGAITAGRASRGSSWPTRPTRGARWRRPRRAARRSSRILAMRCHSVSWRAPPPMRREAVRPRPVLHSRSGRPEVTRVLWSRRSPRR